MGREVRRAFVTPPGTLLLAVDYSQIELRVLAHLSEDTALIDAFTRDEDLHASGRASELDGYHGQSIRIGAAWPAWQMKSCMVHSV